MGPAACAALPAFGAGLFGLLIGSLLFGPLADAIGRKRVLLVAVLVFGGCTGFGLYAIDRIPDPAAFHHRHWPRGRDTDLHYSQLGVLTGAPPHADGHPELERLYRRVGLGGLLAGQIIPAFGWRGVLLVGGIAPLALLPLLAGRCPSRYALWPPTPNMPIGYAGWSSVSPAGVGRGHHRR